MEELRSTEILDKEIREDARRKANRILNNGLLECEKILEDVNIKFEEDAAKKRAEYEEKINNRIIIFTYKFPILICYKPLKHIF